MAERSVVLTSTSSETAPEEPQLSKEDSVCNLCLKQFARYTCPRCGLKYCSLSCYRSEKHLQCSEEFYKEEVVRSLKQQTGSSEDRKKVMEILKRLQEQEVVGEGDEDGLEDAEREEELSLEERLEGLDINSPSLDSADLWDRLTERERKEFKSLLSQGHLGGLLEDYTPWWKVPLPKVSEEDSAVANSLPSLVKDIPSLDSLLHGKPPSPSIKYNIINVLYAYVYVVRLYNGSHLELCGQAAQNVLDISGVLSGCVHSFDSCQEGLTHAITTVQQDRDLWRSSDYSQSVLEDIVFLLQETPSPFLLHALSDVHHLLEGGRRDVKRSRQGPSETTKRLWLAKKKVLFLLSWSAELGRTVKELAPVVQVEIENAKFLQTQFLKEKGTAERARAAHRTIDTCTRTKPLIEELT